MNADQTTPLTDEQLNQIEARAVAATDGPWGVYGFGGDTLIEIAADLEETGHGYRARRVICRLEDEPMDNDPTHREWTAEEDWAQVQADAAFIAHAREDVDALVDEIRRLRAQTARPDADKRHLEDGSTHTVQALTDAGEACVQQACVHAREAATVRQEQYSLRAAVDGVLDEVGYMADDERITAEAAGQLRQLLRDALGLDKPLS